MKKDNKFLFYAIVWIILVFLLGVQSSFAFDNIFMHSSMICVNYKIVLSCYLNVFVLSLNTLLLFEQGIDVKFVVFVILTFILLFLVGFFSF